MAEIKVSRAQLAAMDVEALMLNEKFLRFLSTIRSTAGIETTAYGPEDRHLHFVEGRRSLWCDILRTVELASPEALLLILSEEMKASRETSSGRRKYDRLGTDDGSASKRDGDPDPDAPTYLDYAEPDASS